MFVSLRIAISYVGWSTRIVVCGVLGCLWDFTWDEARGPQMATLLIA